MEDISEKRKCRICALEELEGTDIKAYVEKALRLLPEDGLTDREEYEKRTGICMSCGHYVNFTCKKCGCLVHVRAALRENHCPVKNRKW